MPPKQHRDETALMEDENGITIVDPTIALQSTTLPVDDGAVLLPVRVEAPLPARQKIRALFITYDDVFTSTSLSARTYAGYSPLYEEVHVIVPTLTEYAFDVFQLAPNVWAYPSHSTKWWLYPYDVYKTAKRQLLFGGEFRPDVVVASDPFELGVMALLLARRFKRALSVHASERLYDATFLDESDDNGYRAFAARLVMPRAERIIVRSDHMREVVLQADPTLHDTVAVAMRGYDVSLMGATTPSQTLHEQYPQCTFFMAVVAPLEKESGIAFVLQAASFTLRQYSSVGLVICGDGKERDMLKKIVQEKGISGNVFFEPMPHELASLISAAQVLIVPRQTHASEEALRVAALLGVPAIVSEDALHDDVFEHQQSALVCKRDDLGCAIQSIKTYMNDSVLRIRYAKEAKRRAQVHTVAAHTAGEALYAVLSDAVFAHYAKEDGGVNAAPIIRETPSPITGNQPHV